MELASAAIYNEGKRAVGHYSRIFDFSKGLDDNYKRLKEEAGKLSARRKDIENEAIRYSTKQLTEECKFWISRVKEHEKEVQELETKYKTKYSRRKGRVWDPIFAQNRVKFSKCLIKQCEELCRLWSEGMFERGTLVEKLAERVITMPGPKTEDKPSLHQAVEEILVHLRDPDARRVGLWGRVGVENTTIMRRVNNNEDIAKMFDIVIWLTEPKNWSIKKLQLALAQRLKLDVENITDPDVIASRISKELECKKYLLLLDGVWQVFDLGDIGIHDNQNDGKVVLASSDRRIFFKIQIGDLVRVRRN